MNCKYISAVICIGVMFVFYISILFRFARNQINDSDVRPKVNVTASSYINWESRYPFSSDRFHLPGTVASAMNRYKGFITSIKEKVSYYSNDLLYGRAILRDASKFWDDIMRSPMMSNSKGDGVFFLNNGYLAYTEYPVASKDILEIGESIRDFSDYLADVEIPFLYVNAGSKTDPSLKEIPSDVIENTNQNGNALMEVLGNYGIDTLDLRQGMQDETRDWYDFYYITDHHWKTSSGLWAAQKIANCLNDEYEYQFDTSIFDVSNYDITIYEDIFLGGQGRTLYPRYVGLEDFEEIIPKFETNLHLEIPSRDIDLTGAYEDVLFDKEMISQVLNYSGEDYANLPNAYYCSMLRNDALALIRNGGQFHNQKRILILQDSFGWYLTTYLAMDIECIDVMNPSEFSGSIRRYIEDTRPDMVLMMMCEKNIKPIDWGTHTSMFDLR